MLNDKNLHPYEHAKELLTNRLSLDDRECFWLDSQGFCNLTVSSRCWNCAWCSRAVSFGVVSV